MRATREEAEDVRMPVNSVSMKGAHTVAIMRVHNCIAALKWAKATKEETEVVETT